MNSQQAYPATGEVIDGKYQIEKMLGEGGMGAVAKATHLLRRAPVALKFMSPNVMSFPGAVERFLNEGVAASQIDSDHVVHIFDVGKLPSGAPYLVMEYMQGLDLSEVLQREGQPGLVVERAIHFTLQTLRGLQVAHDAGIIHRDMKPSNCFVVDKEGEPDFVKLLDFGISKVGQGAKSASLTQTNSALGTPLYMSPEQAKSPRDVDLRSDLYSVGVILYELLSGRTPFNSESGEFTEILFKLFTQDPPPIRSVRPDLPPELAAAVHRALVRDPKDRYSTAQEFGLALEPWADARSARVINRLRAHVAGRTSHLPSAHGPAAPVAAAFSKLGMGNQTGAMGVPSHGHVASASTDRPPPMNATPGGLAGQPAQTPVRHSAYPEAPGARAGTAADAVAATQYHAAAAAGGVGSSTGVAPGAPMASQQLGKQTDLGAARDTSLASMPVATRRPSPILFALPAIIIVGVIGAGAWKVGHSSQPTGPAAASTAAPTTAMPDTPPPPAPPPMPSVTATASASAAPSASASATALGQVPVPKRATAAPTSTSNQGGRVHLKDLKPVE